MSKQNPSGSGQPASCAICGCESHETCADVREVYNLPISNSIIAYLHCPKCMAQMPRKTSPAKYARFELGLTELGFQVRCVRHQCNVVHIDFEGMIHPADGRQ